uniref:Ribosome biogenesis protein NOP53 n=1 Tax=Macrostomum lignano TaxID=282301 RepID=A0A1I8FP43_9PLAT
MQNVDVFAKVVLQPLLSAPGYPLLQTSGSMAVALEEDRRAGDLPGEHGPGRRLLRDRQLHPPPAGRHQQLRLAPGWPRSRCRPLADKVRAEEPPDQRELKLPGALQFRQPKFSTEADAMVTELGRLRTRRRVRLSELQQRELQRARQERHPGQAGGPGGQQGGDPGRLRGHQRRKAKASTDLRALNDDK